MKRLVLLSVLLFNSVVFATDNACYKAMIGKTTLSFCDTFTTNKNKLINNGFNVKTGSVNYGSYGSQNYLNFDDGTYDIFIGAFKERIYNLWIYKKYNIKPNYSNVLKKLIRVNNNNNPPFNTSYIQANYHHWKEWCWGDCTYWERGQGDIYTKGKPLICQDDSSCMRFDYLHTPSKGVYELRIEIENNKLRDTMIRVSDKYDKEKEEKASNEF